MNPIAIFAATRWELQAVRRGLATDRVETIDGVRCHIGQQGDRTYWLIQTGVGPAAKLAANVGAGLSLGALAAVDVDRREARTQTGAVLRSDALLIACGAVPYSVTTRVKVSLARSGSSMCR